MLKVKNYSLLGKLAIVLASYTLCILKWVNIIPNATISEIWGAGATAYGLLLGTIDFNIISDNLREHKTLNEEERNGR